MYRIIRFLIFPVFWIVYKLRFKETPGDFYEKIGRPTRDRPNGDIIWIHSDKRTEAVEIIRSVMNAIPHARILQTYNIPDGPSINNVIGQLSPLDSPIVVKQFLQFWEPLMAITTGSEIRPIQLYTLKKYNIPSFLINAQMPKPTYRHWKWIRYFARKTISNLTFVWARDNEQTLRFANLGASYIESESIMEEQTYLSEIIQKMQNMCPDE